MLVVNTLCSTSVNQKGENEGGGTKKKYTRAVSKLLYIRTIFT